MKIVEPKIQSQVKRVIWKYDEYLFPKLLKKFRLDRGLSRTQLGNMVGKEHYQIQRYESTENDNQVPPLETFANICVALQVDPKDLIGLVWVEGMDKPQPGVIYDSKLEVDVDLITSEFRKFYWRCPHCGVTNIEYDAYDAKRKKMIKDEFMCEHCSRLYAKFYNKEKKCQGT